MLYIHNSEVIQPIVAAEEVKGLKSVMILAVAMPAKSDTM
jgi:hypothetical protein